jgi:hypothetical protein
VKVEGTGTVPRENAVQHERVDMDVQIEGSPEPLDNNHRAATTIRDAAVAGAGAQAAEHRADEHSDDGAAQVVVPRQVVPHAVWQAEHPLTHGHIGEHVIEQVRGSLRHPAAAATGTHRAALARKGDQSVEAAVVAAKPREPAGESATLQKVPELLLDETGHAFPVAEAGGLDEKGLDVIVHDLVKRTLGGMPRFVARRGRGHSKPEGGRGASEEPDRVGLNSSVRERRAAVSRARTPQGSGRFAIRNRRT